MSVCYYVLKMFFCLRKKHYLCKRNGITEGENGEGALLGRDEQRRAAAAGTGVRHHLRTTARSVGLRPNSDDHYLLAHCHGAALRHNLPNG